MKSNAISRIKRIILALIIILVAMLAFYALRMGENQAEAGAVDSTECSTEILTEPEPVSLGEFRITAYCACEICCEKWAKCRPIDKNGETIVYTANQSRAKQGVTVAADTRLLPFGTEITILNHEYIVQDRGGNIKGKCINIYFENHEEAVNFGVKYADVYVKEIL